jgi:hypothetical protein
MRRETVQEAFEKSAAIVLIQHSIYNTFWYNTFRLTGLALYNVSEIMIPSFKLQGHE